MERFRWPSNTVAPQITQEETEVQGSRTWPLDVQHNSGAAEGTEEKEAAIKAAVERLQVNNTPSATSKELIKPHAEDPRAGSGRSLVAKHHEKLDKAVEATMATAQKSAPALVPRAEDQKRSSTRWLQLLWSPGELKRKYQADIDKSIEDVWLESRLKHS
ncbi:hypothetical protein EDB92DRAFT_1817715 [Lactarius akahatsu]|uniref:Uncharacterized protein n=1 Tax=Lactarius akahatsu TaxID=416441 RepID=A0AAD4Q954_9AGAM|nr:hypothetical protein EDB92DRAFT_1817715 [Lactarius akahatsu]